MWFSFYTSNSNFVEHPILLTGIILGSLLYYLNEFSQQLYEVISKTITFFKDEGRVK